MAGRVEPSRAEQRSHDRGVVAQCRVPAVGIEPVQVRRQGIGDGSQRQSQAELVAAADQHDGTGECGACGEAVEHSRLADAGVAVDHHQLEAGGGVAVGLAELVEHAGAARQIGRLVVGQIRAGRDRGVIVEQDRQVQGLGLGRRAGPRFGDQPLAQRGIRRHRGS